VFGDGEDVLGGGSPHVPAAKALVDGEPAPVAGDRRGSVETAGGGFAAGRQPDGFGSSGGGVGERSSTH
jgi:hypothetical protein